MDNLYPLLSQLILITISVILFIAMSIAFRKIMKDVNDILDYTDKFVFFIAAIQQLLLLAYLIKQLALFLSGLRILRLLQELNLLNCLIKLESDNEKCSKITDSFQKLIALLLLCGWIASIFYEGYNSRFECNQSIWMLYSGLIFLISFIQFYFGLNILIQIYNYCKDQGNQHMFDGLQKIMIDELQNRKIQVIVFIICSIISSIIMFCYDFLEFNELDPIICLQKQTLLSNIIYIIVTFISYQFSCLGIYYVFYQKNKKYLNNHSWEMQKNLVNFYDERSEIELGDYQNPQ